MEEENHVVEEATGQTVIVNNKKKKNRKRKRENEPPPLVVIGGEEENEPSQKKVKKWKNKTRVLVLSARGVTYRSRHLMNDIRTLLPHSRSDNKIDRKDHLSALIELCEMKNCTKGIFFEMRKRKDLYMWIANLPNGPSAKFLVENVHTMDELKLTGNCLLGSRPLLSFDPRLIVVLKQNLYVHNIKDMKVMHTIRDTPKNPTGLCALSHANDTALIAYPGNIQTGEVQVFDAMNLRAVAGINAHDSPLAALQFNSTGTKLATASTTGTVIRVFNIPQGDKLLEFRRGMKRFIQISCLAFSEDSNYLATSSSTETVHVFKLTEPTAAATSTTTQEPILEDIASSPSASASQQSWMSYLGKALSGPASYLPSQVTEPFSQSRAFAQVRLPQSGVKSVCGIANVDGVHKILVATSEGVLYVSSIDPKEGGECRYKMFSLLGNPSMPLEPTTGLTGLYPSNDSISDDTTAPVLHEDEESPPKTHSVQS